MQQLDSIDKQLLNLLQQNNRKTAEELGAKLSLSTSAVQRRLQRLRSSKVIEADVSIVSPEAAGMHVSFIVEVSLNLGNSTVVDNFVKLMNACPEVSQCYYVAGLYDFILVVNTKDMKHYEAFSKKNLMDNKTVKQFYTHVVLNRVKMQYGMKL
jgi:Lrp/AsnC family transcriptional regulator, leucine-responsive regulatory protein